MKLLKLIIAAAFLPLFASAQSLKLSLAKGTKYEVTSTVKTTSVATIMGQEMESGSDINTTELINVKDTRAGETDLTTTITKVVANIQAMGQETVYDSDKKDNTGAGTEAFEKLKGKVKNVTVDANGKVIKEDKDDEGSDAVTMMGASGNGLSLINKTFVGRQMKPGTTWYDSLTTTGDKVTTFTEGNYTVLAVNDGTATIGFLGTTKLNGTMEQMGMEMAMTSTSKVTGQFEIEMATGLVKKTTQTTDGTMSIEAAGMSIPVTTKTSVTILAKQL